LDGTIDMQTIPSQDVAALLDRNDYRVVMQKTDGGCITHFPVRAELPTPGFLRLYQEFTKDGVLVCEHEEGGLELDKYEVPCPPYAQRLYTIYQVVYHCMGIGYDVNLVKFVVNDHEVEEQDFFDAHASSFMDTSDIKNENILRNIVASCFQQGFLPQYELAAKQESVEEGFVAIRRLFMPDQALEQLNNILGNQL